MIIARKKILIITFLILVVAALARSVRTQFINLSEVASTTRLHNNLLTEKNVIPGDFFIRRNDGLDELIIVLKAKGNIITDSEKKQVLLPVSTNDHNVINLIVGDGLNLVLYANLAKNAMPAYAKYKSISAMDIEKSLADRIIIATIPLNSDARRALKTLPQCQDFCKTTTSKVAKNDTLLLNLMINNDLKISDFLSLYSSQIGPTTQIAAY
jgi:hypothetical protein